MISATGDIGELLQAVQNHPLVEILSLVTEEKRAAEALARRTPHPLPLRAQMFDYTQSCRELKWWLTTKNKPRNCSNFQLFERLTASLIERGDLPAVMLEAFN